jgi:hypothetical protein
MATYRILYWQEVPSQIKADDGDNEVTLPLSPRFIERIDRLAMQRGLHDADAYLAHWRWGEEQEREGSAQEVAEAVRAELESEGGAGGSACP